MKILTNVPAIHVCLAEPARINKMGFSADVLKAQVVSCLRIDLYGHYFSGVVNVKLPLTALA